MRVLIAGCGDLGTRLGLLLAAEGHEVWGARRQVRKLPDALHGLAVDLGDRESLSRLPKALDLVVYTAAADQSTEEAYRRAYVDGLRNVLTAVGSGPERILFVSSTSVYGQREGEWVDEASPTEPNGFRGRLILEGEKLLAAQDSSTMVVRFAGIYGPGRTRLIDSVRSGTAVCFDDPPLYTNRIHVEDCAGVLRHLALAETTPGASHGAVLGVDHEPAADGEVKRWLARQLGVPEPPSLKPFSEPGEAAGPRSRASKRCTNRLLLASGYRFLFPDFRAGYSAVLKELG